MCFRCLVSCMCVSDSKLGLWKPWRRGGSGITPQVETTITFDRSSNVCELNTDYATHCSSELFALCGNSFSATWSSSEQTPFSHVVFSKWCYRAFEHLQRRDESQSLFSSFPLFTVLWLKIIFQTIGLTRNFICYFLEDGSCSSSLSLTSFKTILLECTVTAVISVCVHKKTYQNR